MVALQDPGTLFPPFIVTVQAKQIAEQIYDYLADVGPSLNTRSDRGFRPQLATGWTWSGDSLQISFAINPRARWHDAERVTAHDVALPGARMGKLGFLMYPVAEDQQGRFDSYAPDDFKYQITAKEIGA